MTIAAKSVPFFDYAQVFTSKQDGLLATINSVGRRGAFIMQSDLFEFERDLAEYVGAKHVVGVANATDGLHLALRAADIGDGDEVIFSSHTMVATAGAIHLAGATPVPVECGLDHQIDPASAKAAINERTKAIMPTQLNGRTCDMDSLQELAERHNLVIIEDAAQSLGGRFKGRSAGTFGLAGVISFYPAKTLGCLGDGGCVITNSDEIDNKLRLLRDHGRDENGDVVLWGLNSRLDNLQAAILNFKLKTYDESVARRRTIARLYHDQLSGVAKLVLPPAPDSDPDRFDIYQNYEIEAERRDDLREHLKRHGVGTLIQWGGKAVHQFEKLGFTQRLPYTEAMFERLLLLPMNTSINDEDVDYVCSVMQSFYQE